MILNGLAMKKLLLLLAFLSLSSTHSTFSQTQMLWSKPPTPYDANNFNQNQFDCPLWFGKDDLFKVNGIIKGDTHSTIVRDFNNDGYCDVLLSFFLREDVFLPFILYLYNPISGQLENKSSLISNNVGQPFNRKAVSADFNGDGILDAVAVSQPDIEPLDLSYLDVIMSNETGWEQITLSVASNEGHEGYYHGCALGDIDNDGDIDILVGSGNPFTEGIISFINDGNGNFEKGLPMAVSDDYGQTWAWTLELEDINSDGFLDLIYMGEGSRIAYGNGDGTFGSNFQELDYGDWVSYQDYDFVDFDNDGDKDLILNESIHLPEKWELIFLRNDGIDNEGKVVYEDITEPITTDLKRQNYYLDESTRDGITYIQVLDLNNDGILDIIDADAFGGDYSIGLIGQDWVLIGQEDLKFKYVNYPFVSPLKNIAFDKKETEVDIIYETVYLRNVPNPFIEEQIMEDLRGEINEWVVYYRQSPFGDKSLERVKRTTISNEAITKEFLGNNTFKYTFNFQPEFEGSDDIYARVTYVDEYGIENVLSEQLQFSVSEFDYDGDGVPNVSDDCPDTPTGVSVNGSGCSESQLADDDGDSVPNYLDECPNTSNGEMADAKGCSDSQKDDDEDGVMNDVDNCPQISNENQEDLDGDGEGDVCDDDWDGDGVLNSEDICPEISNSNQSDLDNDGEGDACDDDWDGDGILNSVDNCPETSNSNQSDIDNDGLGDACDDDIDGDGIVNSEDNCPEKSNENQEDLDNDGEGDTCDDDWDGDGILNSVDNCPEIVNADQADFDGDNIGDICDDDIDGDGVLNDDDMCSNTPVGTSVDANGCTLLDSNNFTIEIISETCPDKDNGKIIIEAQTSNSYIATIGGVDYDFNTNKTIDDLKPGDYEICIVITDQTSPYCYNVTIGEGTTVSGKSSTTKNKTNVDILEGTAPYDVYINGTSILRTMSSTFDIDTKHGDLIEVKTDVACEGVYFKTVQLFDIMTLYPNPTQGLFELSIPLNLNEVEIELYNYNSQVISKRFYPVSYGKVQLDLTNKSTGMYYVKVLSDTSVMLKIIKK